MNLPNYFLADLPPDASLSPAMIAAACHPLKRNREKYLRSRSTDDLVTILCEVAVEWLQPANKFRRLALELGPAETGFSKAILKTGLDAFFAGSRRRIFELYWNKIWAMRSPRPTLKSPRPVPRASHLIFGAARN